jgi:hypothetical protein
MAIVSKHAGNEFEILKRKVIEEQTNDDPDGHELSAEQEMTSLESSAHHAAKGVKQRIR